MRKKIFFLITIILIISLFFIKNYHKFKYIKEIKRICKTEDVEVVTILAIAKVESNFREKVVSPKGAVGIMQVMPSTAEWVIKYKKVSIPNYDLKNYKDNIRIGVTYYKFLEEVFNKDLERCLAGYNAGPSRVVNGDWKKIEETRKYVKKVMFYKKIYNLFY